MLKRIKQYYKPSGFICQSNTINYKFSEDIKKKYSNKYFNNFITNYSNNKYFNYLLIFLISGVLYYELNKPEELNYYQLLEMIRSNDISKIEVYELIDNLTQFKSIHESEIYLTCNNNNYKSKIISNDEFISDLSNIFNGELFDKLNIIFYAKHSSENLSNIFMKYFPRVFYIGSVMYLVKRNIKNIKFLINPVTINDIKKAPVKKFEPLKSKIVFNDIFGLKEPKKEVSEFIDFLKNPDKYKLIGAKVPKGGLLCGPPGTGKTLLAKACANEADCPFYYISGSEFVQMYVGVGSSRVRDLFKTARENKKAIIFIDEIDAIGKKRSASNSSSSESDSTLNQLLVEMDGFENDASTVIVFAATNRKELLDEALIRPGRFDRIIDVPLPNVEEREEGIRKLLKKSKNNKILDYEIKRLAALTPRFSYADIQNAYNEAGINAVRDKRDYIKESDLEIGVERVLGGMVKENKVEEEDTKRVVYHEAGHAVVSWFLRYGMPLLKVSVIPRARGALGFAQYFDNENMLNIKEELEDKIVAVLGGKCSEQYFFNNVSTGAYDDLQKAQQLAHNIVTKFGMGEMGYINFEEDSYGNKYFSEETNSKIDKEVQNIIANSTDKCLSIIKENEELIKKFSAALLEKKTLNLEDIITVLGKKPYPVKENIRPYFEEHYQKLSNN